MEQTVLIYAYFTLSGGYIAAVRAVLFDILSPLAASNQSTIRYFGVTGLGASMGLFAFAWIFVLSPEHTPEFAKGLAQYSLTCAALLLVTILICDRSMTFRR